MTHPHDARPRCDEAVALAFSVLGKRWNGMILDALSRGAFSFSAIRGGVPGISDAVLSDRLTALAEAGLVHRGVTAGPPLIVEYTLTPAGENLIPVLHQLGQWAEQNLDIHEH